jgi:hypothetical protein
VVPVFGFFEALLNDLFELISGSLVVKDFNHELLETRLLCNSTDTHLNELQVITLENNVGEFLSSSVIKEEQFIDLVASENVFDGKDDVKLVFSFLHLVK